MRADWWLLAGLLAVAPLLIGTAQVEASGAGDVVVHRDWAVVETPTGGCVAVQQVRGRRTGALLVEVVVDRPASSEGHATIALRVPTGAHLPDGIAYRHGAAARAGIGLEWQSCDGERCTAAGTLTEAEVARLLRGREIVVGYRPLKDSRLLNVPVSLMGLTAAWRHMSTCDASVM